MIFKADILKKKMKENRLTQAKLATILKKDKRTISRWLSGDNAPKQNDIEKIAKILKCLPQEFDPFFFDNSLGEIPIHAHVSVASHNAYMLMGWRYQVSKKQIMELAPILFSIVAGYALNIPKKNSEISTYCHKNGIQQPIEEPSWTADSTAAHYHKCFGINSTEIDPFFQGTNLFYEAIRRICLSTDNYINMKWFHEVPPGEIPKATGFISDVELLKKLSNEKECFEEAIVKGRICLSTILTKLKKEKKSVQIEDFSSEIQKNYEQEIDNLREISLKKLKAWREFYQQRYPDLAKEYDILVAKHCHKEGWFPKEYTSDDCIQSEINPYKEDHFINADTLIEYQEEKIKSKDLLIFPMNDPVFKRFYALKDHRNKIKKEFEEIWS